MDPTTILVSGAVLGGIGAVSAALLAGAAKAFAVEEDPRVGQLTDALPGANCGGCGYAGCAGFAAALAEGKADPTACAPGGAATAQKLGAILGVLVAEKARQVARLRCNGGAVRAFDRAAYTGMSSCKAVTLLIPGGSKKCPQACEGLGDCVAVCAFGAITLSAEKLPVIDEGKCTGCGKCVEICPKVALQLHPFNEKLSAACGNQIAPKLVRKVCEVGCLHCKLCVRTCPYEALVWENNLPKRVDGKCVMCGLCVDACRTKVMHLAPGIVPNPEVREAAKKLQAERKAAAAAAKPAAKPAEAKPIETKPAEASAAKAEPEKQG